MFCFIALMKSITQNVRGVTERHCLSKRILSQQKIGHEALTQYIQYFAYEVGIISSYLNRICYWKIAKSRIKHAWELQRGSKNSVWETLFNK